MLGTRIITGLVLGITVTAAVLLLPTRGAGMVLAALWLAGAWEWAGLARFGRFGRALYVALFAAAMAAVLLVGSRAALADAVLVLALVAWLLALAGILTYPRPIAPAVVLVAGAFGLLPAWVLLLDLHGSSARGPALTLMALGLVWAADVGAYFVGSQFGRIKLAPRVSPGKTWEGVTGGTGLAMLVGWLASLWLGLPLLAMVAIAAATALVSVVGDLTVSMLKRNVGLKDSGRLLPGHGGVMDRIDGLIAAVPFFVLGLELASLL